MSYRQRVVIEESSRNIAIVDALSNLIKDRIIFIDGEIDEDMANGVIAQLLHLNSEDPNKVIHIYINSFGGSVYDGLAIYDISKIISAPIRTVCIGKAASMAAILMLMGDERCSTENARFMLHQPSGGTYGNAEELKIYVEEMAAIKKILYDIIKSKTNIDNPYEECLFDRWYSSQDALESGIIHEILTSKK